MRYLLICLLIASSANALTRDQAKKAMTGEDLNEVMSNKPSEKTVEECHYDAQCRYDEYCHKERQSDSKGICVKKSKD